MRNEDKVFEVRLPKGVLRVTSSQDLEYPGVDVEYIADNDNGEELSRPRVLIELPEGGTHLRALIWDDPNEEDFTREIDFGDVISTKEDK